METTQDYFEQLKKEQERTEAYQDLFGRYEVAWEFVDTSDHWGNGHLSNNWKVKVTRFDEGPICVYEGEYHTGLSLSINPEDILRCLGAELTTVLDCCDISTFQSAYGYSDAGKCIRDWQALQAEKPKLTELFGPYFMENLRKGSDDGYEWEDIVPMLIV
jgi:hypothetical protein